MSVFSGTKAKLGVTKALSGASDAKAVPATAIERMSAMRKLAGVFAAAAQEEAVIVDSVLSTDSKEDDKQPCSTAPDRELVLAEQMRAAMHHLRSSGGGGKGSKSKQVYRTRLAVRTVQTGSSNAFLGGVFALAPMSTSVTEATAFATLFDEWRCTSVTTHSRILAKGTFPTPTLGAAWIVVYDPANSGAYSSVVGGLVARQHYGPVAFAPDNDAATQSFTKSGYHTFRAKVPVPVAPTASSAPQPVGCSWVGTFDQTSIVGYLKCGADALGASTQAEWDLFVVYDMEFRSRT
jgi:hypothetical protein